MAITRLADEDARAYSRVTVPRGALATSRDDQGPHLTPTVVPTASAWVGAGVSRDDQGPHLTPTVVPTAPVVVTNPATRLGGPGGNNPAQQPSNPFVDMFGGIIRATQDALNIGVVQPLRRVNNALIEAAGVRGYDPNRYATPLQQNMIVPSSTTTAPARTRPVSPFPANMPRAEQTRQELPTTSLLVAQILQDAVNAGRLPEKISIANAEQLGYLDDLVGAGYTQIGSQLVAPPTGAAGGGGGGGGGGGAGGGYGNDFRAAGYNSLADMLRAQGVANPNLAATQRVAAENYQNRERLSWTDAYRQHAQQEEEARRLSYYSGGNQQYAPRVPTPYSIIQSFGLVNFNTSTG